MSCVAPRPSLVAALTLWAAVLLGAPAAQAVQRALLVGVSELANQPASLWLQAPRNDVMLMRDALRLQGFAPGDVTVLADGVPGAALPDARGIRDALARLLADSGRGDFVLLYFSGHGTRVRDRAKAYAEPDGLAENFLARDALLPPAGGAGDQPLAGGLRDVDMDGWIRAFLARGVFVWSVFDTCAATSMTRGAARQAGPDIDDADDPVLFRGVRIDQLAGAAAGTPLPDSLAPPPQPVVPRARYVAFFASESHQVTPELRLPRRDRTARAQGLLTWAVTQAMARRPATFRALYNQVVSLYAPVVGELEARFPTRELPSPVAEGNLDLPLFGNAPAPLSTRPAWPARRIGGAQLALSVGRLDGLVPGQALRVLATLEDGTQRNATATLDDAQLSGAQLLVPPALAGLGDAALWSVVPLAEPPAAQLRVSSSGGALPAGISLAYPAAIRPVRGGEAADVQVDGPDSVRIVSPELAALVNERAPPLAGPDALRDYLQALASLQWLAQVRELARQGAALEGFDATVEVWSGAGQRVRSAAAADVDALAPLAAGERASLAVRNASGHSLDLVVVGIAPDGAIRPVYPPALAETNRFERGTPERPALQRFDLPWLDPARGGRLLVLAAPATPFSAPRLFGATPPESTPGLRLRGAAPPPGTQRQVYGALVAWPAAR